MSLEKNIIYEKSMKQNERKSIFGKNNIVNYRIFS